MTDPLTDVSRNYETVCDRCGGSGLDTSDVDRALNAVEQFREHRDRKMILGDQVGAAVKWCQRCQGHGYVPSELGIDLLRFVARWTTAEGR